MEKEKIYQLQISALSRINFCFYELKSNPPLKWENNVFDKESIEKTRNNFLKLDLFQRKKFKEELFQYLDRESTTEARLMLVINYLFALLVKCNNNQISIYKNFEDKIQKIEDFKSKNNDIVERLSMARKKLYAHIDLNWQECAKSITFDELEICINFLNDLFNYRVF